MCLGLRTGYFPEIRAPLGSSVFAVVEEKKCQEKLKEVKSKEK